jgi:uncharacterized membrane protein (GlpM family)
MMEYIVRFIAGGLAVSAFSALGDILRPKSFAGLFGAAPSIALVTLVIAVSQHSPEYAETEARSMMVGSASLCLYSLCVCRLMAKYKVPALLASGAALAIWLGCAFGLAWVLLGGLR